MSSTIGATGIGASGVASIDQSVSNAGAPGLDLSLIPDNTVHVNGSVTGRNTATVDSHFTSVGASIANGIANSITSTAIGASAAAGISSRFENVVTGNNTAGGDNKVTVDKNLFAKNTAAVTANGAGADKITASAAISDGVSNSITAVAIGATASASITQSVSNSSAFNPTQLPDNTVKVNNITARNTANIAATQTIVGSSGLSAAIGAGVENTIGSQAVGASAGAAISSQFLNVSTGSTGGQSNKVSANQVVAHNTGKVTADTELGKGANVNTTTISGGVANSITASAIGASALASINQTASFGTTGAMNVSTMPSNTVTIAKNITSTNGNNAPVTATLNIMGQPTSTTSITSGVGNSITAQAIGSLAGATITQHINNVHN